ncbi:hypothetical protein SAMN04487965_1357 [Microbulbifer donghaiensis]|uniref:Uncharacterized protein n=1 Tax=Microbulbifer donghaiensis TaxID=494016 RepID=A0A1M4YV07_9GAMM|nr:hypothetical protein [Microbulbifer donghaiensis]SHF09601.1 hypothetical protein SAMN04487965_1357 [Microbulbifer donghaiensis]
MTNLLEKLSGSIVNRSALFVSFLWAQEVALDRKVHHLPASLRKRVKGGIWSHLRKAISVTPIQAILLITTAASSTSLPQTPG